MNNTPAHTYRNWFLLGLLVQLIAAWFSVGYHQPDEHFQVLEFCNYKLSHSSAKDLAWEFQAQCRPALQPFIAWCLCRFLEITGTYNPFIAAFLLRLSMGILTWWVTCRMLLLLLPEMVTQKGKQALVFCSFFLWFVPYIGVRFSAENFSGLLFFLALSFLLYIKDSVDKKNTLRLLIAGLFIGFAVFIRLQVALAVIALAASILLYRKWPIRYWVMLLISGVAAIALSVVVDYWFYGQWVFTPYNYFNVNIIQHVAAKFGVTPWWYYITDFIAIGVPPISVVLLPLFFVGLWQKPRHLLSWIAVLFIAGHCFIGHKEMRFLFPVSIAFIFLACTGFDAMMSRYPAKKIYRWAIPLFVSLNIAMLVIRLFMPAQEGMKYFEFLYNFTKKQNTILVSSHDPVYTLVGLKVNFYKPQGLDERIIESTAELSAILHEANGRPVLFLSHEMTPGPLLDGYKTEKVYCILPAWMSRMNFNDWQSRSSIWTIYRVFPK